MRTSRNVTHGAASDLTIFASNHSADHAAPAGVHDDSEIMSSEGCKAVQGRIHSIKPLLQSVSNIVMSAASSSATVSTASAPLTLMGVTGNTGGNAVNALLARNDSNIFIRGIVRSQEKGEAWKAKLSEKYGADKVSTQVTFVAADQADVAALTKAFSGSSAVYVMLSPSFPDSAYEEAKKRVSTITDALKTSMITRVVALSSFGAHFSHDQVRTGAIIYQVHLLEKALVKELGSSATITAVRAGGFFENALHGEMAQARFNGKFGNFYAHLDVKYPHVSSKDIGAEIAKNLVDQTDRKAPLYVELEGPQRYSINDFATFYAKIFGREVVPFSFPREGWSPFFQSIGIPKERTFGLEDMYDSLNAGKLTFENKPENGTVSVKGTTTLEAGLTEIIKNWDAQQAAAAAQKAQ